MAKVQITAKRVLAGTDETDRRKVFHAEYAPLDPHTGIKTNSEIHSILGMKPGSL
jgi:hypothetical protein